MKNLKTMQTTLTLALGLIFSGASVAASLNWIPPQTGDLHADNVVAAKDGAGFAAASSASAKEAVSVSWPAARAGKAGLAAEAAPSHHPLVQSRESYRKVSGRELNAGVDIETTEARALVRLQALSATGLREQQSIHPQYLTITPAGGKAMNNGEAMEWLVSPERLAKSGLPFASGTSAFRIHGNLGKGKLKLQAAGLDDNAEYMLNIVEKNSPLVFELRTEAADHRHGDVMTVHATLREHGAAAQPGKVRAVLVAPSGREYALNFKPGKHGMSAKLALDAHEQTQNGLWEVRAHAAKGEVERFARLAFPVMLPTARLAGDADLRTAADGALIVALGVQAGSGGRYQVRGTLYGMLDGAMQAIATADSAKWLDAGRGQIGLAFDPALLAGASGPFELRDLSLHDQGRLSVLQRQALAVQLDAGDLKRAGFVARHGVAAQAAGSFGMRFSKPDTRE